MYSLEELLGKFVAIPSVSGFEERLAVYISRFCHAQGHHVQMINGSVAVRIEGRNRRRALILNGHLDTVPGDHPGALHMAVGDERLRGLGVTDMKSGLAVMCMIAQIYRFTPAPCDIWLFFSKEEETTAQGSLDLSDWWTKEFSSNYAKKAVIILEPTGNSFVSYAHKGGGVFRTLVAGNGTFHGSKNLVGYTTALDRVCRFGSSLKSVQRRWLRLFPNAEYGAATINLTHIRSLGNSPNVVPDNVEVFVDIRTNDTLSPATLIQEFEVFTKRFGVTLRLDDMHGAEVIRCNDPTVLRHVFYEALPEIEVRSFPAATDMNAFLRFGLAVAIFGPGNESLHQRCEDIERGAMEACLIYLTRVIKVYASYC